MRRTILILTLVLHAVCMMGIPAKRDVWRTLILADGTEVRAQLQGDERRHFWVDADGGRYVRRGSIFVREDDVRNLVVGNGASLSGDAIGNDALLQHKSGRFHQATARTRQIDDGGAYLGMKRGLVILVEYADVAFREEHTAAKFGQVFNERGYATDEGFRGSVADYFHDQSSGLFELEFDVVGPVRLAHERKYYGANTEDGDDRNPMEMVVEGCRAIGAMVNFADYDWDGDGVVEQVYVLYAGTGEAESGDEDDVWPHMWYLSATDMAITLDGVVIDAYACSNEVTVDGTLEGIGTFCHEFSHCLGFPDFYDTLGGNCFGMGHFDLLDRGNYNGNSFCPAGYTAYEKMTAGWLQPVVLSADTVITSVPPASEGGQTYIIYNDAWPDEYYLVENRQYTGWDAALPDCGLMITHVDYDEEIWWWNIPNSLVASGDDFHAAGYPINNHQRMTIFHADNHAVIGKEQGDLYPRGASDSLTVTSTPAATIYHTAEGEGGLLNKSLTDITRNADGTISFRFHASGTPSQGTSIQLPFSSQREAGKGRIYSLGGQYMGTDFESLPPGIYIVNGKKRIVK